MTDQPQVRLVGLSEERVERLRRNCDPDGVCRITEDDARFLIDSYEAGITVEEVEALADAAEIERPRLAAKLRRFTQQGEPDG